MKPEVFIRTDGSSKIGLGHFFRCLALGFMLKERFSIKFLCKEIPDKLKDDLLVHGFGLEVIKNENEFFEKIFGCKIVILDGYDFDSNYQKRIREAGCKLVCIDDLHDRNFFADLIINHAPGIEESDYNAQEYTQFSLGLDYVLLRPAFLLQAKEKRVLESIDNFFICFGGADIRNLTLSTLLITLRTNAKKIIVVTGSAYTNLNSLSKVVNSDSRIKHYHEVNENQMLSLMVDSQLAIVPSSGILLEALASGCKIVSGMYVDNQKLLFEHFKGLGSFESAESFEECNVKVAIDNILNNRTRLINLIDGESGRRNLSKIAQLLTSIRNVTEEDCLLLYGWANDFSVRNNAISKDLIMLDDHIQWFNSKIKSKDCRIYILEYNGKSVGQIRYDKKDNYWLIDYSVDSEYRGLGLGKLLIQKTIHFFENCKIRALVMKENKSSINIFNFFKFQNVGCEFVNNEAYLVFDFQHI